MLKKLFSVAGFLLAIFLISYLIQNALGDSALGTLLSEYFVIYGIVWAIVGLIFGTITLYISESKGYEGGFAWGFWLGIIGLLVVGFRPNKKNAVSHIVSEQKHSSIEVLERLANLHKQGLLTDEEYQEKKTKILARL